MLFSPMFCFFNFYPVTYTQPKISSFNYIQIYNLGLFIICTMLCITDTEFDWGDGKVLIMGVGDGSETSTLALN